MHSNPELIGFEINTAIAAILSPDVRVKITKDLFQPFPSFYIRQDISHLNYEKQLEQRNNFVLIKGGKINSKPDHNNKDIDLLLHDIISIPSFDQLFKAKNEIEIRNMINMASNTNDETTRRISLLRYLISTDKNNLILLKNEDAPFGAINNLLQILIIPPHTKENKEFLALKQKHGSQFLFHGTGYTSSYSILRNGVIVLSGTYLMKVGQAHGPGIYCGLNFTTS